MNTPREWEEEFEEIWKPLVKHNPVTLADKLVVDAWNGKRTQLKSFIRTIEDKAREEERERVRKLVEGMNQPEKRGHYGPYDHLHIQHNIGYNQALSNIITALNEKEV